MHRHLGEMNDAARFFIRYGKTHDLSYLAYVIYKASAVSCPDSCFVGKFRMLSVARGSDVQSHENNKRVKDSKIRFNPQSPDQHEYIS